MSGAFRSTDRILEAMYLRCRLGFDGNDAETATGGSLRKQALLKISQNSQEGTCARVSFLIK